MSSKDTEEMDNFKCIVKKAIDNLEDKQDKQTELLQEIAVSLAVISKDIEGIKGKALATEDKLKLVDNQITVVERHVHMVEGGVKLFSILAIVGGLVKLALQVNGI